MQLELALTSLHPLHAISTAYEHTATYRNNKSTIKYKVESTMYFHFCVPLFFSKSRQLTDDSVEAIDWRFSLLPPNFEGFLYFLQSKFKETYKVM